MKIETPQQWFDTVMAHLRQQECRSANGRMCALRGSLGNACAIGCTIPDDHISLVDDNTLGIDKDFMIRYADLDGVAWPDPEKYGFHVIYGLALQMQELHDKHWWEDKSTRNPDGERYAESIAKMFGLKYTPLAKAKTNTGD